MKKITAYQCDFCPKHYLYKSSAVRHEKRCYLNPQNKACLTCGNYLRSRNTVYVPPYDGNPGSSDYDVTVYYCQSSGKSFTEDNINKRQEFQHDCKNWIPIQCGRDCDNCELDDCLLERDKNNG